MAGVTRDENKAFGNFEAVMDWDAQQFLKPVSEWSPGLTDLISVPRHEI